MKPRPGVFLLFSCGECFTTGGAACSRFRVLEGLKHRIVNPIFSIAFYSRSRSPEKLQTGQYRCRLTRRPSAVELAYRDVHWIRRLLHGLAALFWFARRWHVAAVYTRDPFSTAIALTLRPLFGYNVIRDCRGVIEELIHTRRLCMRPLFWLAEWIDRWTSRSSNLLMAVSNALANHICVKYGLDEPVAVVPNIASLSSHLLAEERANTRHLIRAELKATGRKIMVYAGGTAPWQMVPETIRLFRRLKASDPSFFFLFMTENVADATSLFLQAGMRQEDFTIRSVPQSEMFFYYSAADIGVCLRDASLVNLVACPTKVVEYITAGLPVIVSASVGDFPQLIESRGLGIVLPNGLWEDGNLPEDLCSRISNLATVDISERTPEVAYMFSPERNLDEIARLVSQLPGIERRRSWNQSKVLAAPGSRTDSGTCRSLLGNLTIKSDSPGCAKWGSTESSPDTIVIVATVAAHLRSFHLEWVRHLRARGHKVIGVARDISSCAVCKSAFDEVADVSFSRKWSSFPQMLFAGRELRRIVKASRAALVHFHTPNAGFWGRLALRMEVARGECRVAYTAHGFHFHKNAGGFANAIYRFAERTAAHYTHALLTINSHDAQEARRFGLAPGGFQETLPGAGVDFTRFDPVKVSRSANRETLCASLHLPTDSTLVLMIAEMIPRKRHRDAIDALENTRSANIHLLLAGAGPEEQRLRNQVRRAGLSKQVHFLGYRQDIPGLLAAADVVVLPSGQEGLPVCVIEAMAMEKPVVVASVRGSRDLVDPDCGWLHEVGDIRTLASLLLQIPQNPSDAGERGRKARKRVVSRYGWPAVQRKLERVYAQLGVWQASHHSNEPRGVCKSVLQYT